MEKFKDFLRKINPFKSRSHQSEEYDLDDAQDFSEDSKIDIEMPKELSRGDAHKLKSFGKKFTATMREKISRTNIKASGSGVINFNRLYQAIFSPESRPFIHKSFLVLFICGSTFLMSRLVAIMLTPDTKISKTKSTPIIPSNNSELSAQLSSIRKNDLFNAEGDTSAPVVEKKKVDENLVCKEASRKSNLPINLVSTIVLQDSVKSVASVQMRGKKALDYLREGEKVGNLAQIGSIVDKRLILKNLNSGQCEYIAAKEKREKKLAPIKVERNPQKGRKIIQQAKMSGIVNEGNKFKIKKSLRDELMKDMSSILTQARAIPIQNPDGTMSFAMQEIVPGSIFSNLNIQDGDIISNINGKAINNMNEIMSQFQQIKTRDRYEISLKRNGEEIDYEYDFVD